MARITIETESGLIEMGEYPIDQIAGQIQALNNKIGKFTNSLTFWRNMLEAAEDGRSLQQLRAASPLWRGVSDAQSQIKSVEWQIKLHHGIKEYLIELREDNLAKESEATRLRHEGDLVAVDTGGLGREEAWARYG